MIFFTYFLKNISSWHNFFKIPRYAKNYILDNTFINNFQTAIVYLWNRILMHNKVEIAKQFGNTKWT